jgi:hypothetical protein
MAVLNVPIRLGWGRLNLGRGLCWAALCVSGLYSAAAHAAPEYQLKAAFLFRFAEFVDWPAQAFADAQTPLGICVLGSDPFDSYLDDTVQGEKVDGRSIVIHRYSRLDDVGACHILFISNSEHARQKQDFAALKGRSVLTVGDSDGFAGDGGMIGFTVKDNRIRLQINPDATRGAALKISSKLLEAAEIVGGESAQ